MPRPAIRAEPAIPAPPADEAMRLRAYAERLEGSYDDLRTAYDGEAEVKNRCAEWARNVK